MPIVSIFSRQSSFVPVPPRLVPSSRVAESAIEPISVSSNLPTLPINLPVLPPDVIILIIECALPLVQNYDNFTHRSSNLRRFSHVWPTISQELLIRAPVLSCPESTDLFLVTLKERRNRGGEMEGQRYSDLVRAVRFGRGMRVRVGNEGDGFQNSTSVMELLRVCSCVQILWINGKLGLQLDHLGSAQNLRSLFLFDIDVTERWTLAPPLVQLSLLTQLSLRGVRFPNLSTALEFILSLPNLKHLAIYPMEQSIYLPLLTFILPLPQLESLSISLEKETIIPFSDSGIKCLWIRSSSQFTSTTIFPRTLQHLHIEKFADRSQQLKFLYFVVTLLEPDLPRLANKVYLAPGFTKKRRIDDDGRGDEEDLSVTFAVLEIQRACAKAGVEVITEREEDIGGDGMVHNSFFNKTCLIQEL